MHDDTTKGNTPEELAAWCRFQALAEPFYGALLEAMAQEVERGGPGARALQRIAHLPVTENLPLRLMGAAHRVALAGAAPAYAAHLPTCGGDGDAQAAVDPFLALCASGALDHGVLAPVQTNEPARTSTLLPGFAAVATATGLPLRLREIGASAGLLLNVDRYHHTFDDAAWGDPASPVRLRCKGTAPLAPFVVADRRGCDPNPLDPERHRHLLLSFVWPTQTERFARVEAALRLAAEHPVTVDRMGAATWLRRELAEPTSGVATVVYESVVWQYIPAPEQAEVVALMQEAATRATAEAPLAWLRLEPHARPDLGAELRLTIWPGDGEERVLALCGYHGTPVRWQADLAPV
jgi:hypothetical protein